jgi:hemolysin activation/secretion protein
LPQLIPGSSPSSVKISRALTVANQNSGKRTKLTLSSGDNAGNIDAVLSVVDQKPLVISAWTNNTGTKVSGDYRIGASVVHRNLFDRDHVASLAFITSPENFNEVQQYALNYRFPLYSLGSSVNLLAVKSEVDTGTVAEVFDVAGKGQVLGIGYSQVLAKLGEYRHQVSFQLMDKLFDNDISFQGTQLLPDVRTRPLSLSYQNSWQSDIGLELSGTISVVRNLSGGANNVDQSYELTRPGAEQSWGKVELAANLQYSTEKWLYTAALMVSESSDRLVTGEQFGLGGSTTVRGMEERELRGDRGASLNLQAWGPSVFKSIRPIIFLDAGWVDSNDAIAGEVTSESVLSAGVMLNWNPRPEWSASLAIGYLVDGIDFDDGNQLDFSRDGDSKFHLNVTYRY